MPAASTVRRALRRALSVPAFACLVATCSDGPTEPPAEPPLLVEADTVMLDFTGRADVQVEPIDGRAQWVVIELGGPHANDSLSARLSRNGVTVSSTMVFPASGSPRGLLWIPRTQSDTTLTLDLEWIRRIGSTTVRTFLMRPGVDPEHTPRILAVGDTAVEYLDGDADQDQFMVTTTANTRLVAWVSLDSASQPLQLTVMVEHPLYDLGTRTTPLGESTPVPVAFVRDLGPFPTIAIRVRAATGTVGTPNQIEARYRVWVTAVDPGPETAVAALADGDTLAERINGLGDIDRYTIGDMRGEEFRLFLARDSATAVPVRARIETPGELPVTLTLPANDTLLDLTRTLWLRHFTAGTSTVEITADTSVNAERRPFGYRLLFQRRPKEPETRPMALGLIDSVTTETLSSCADADEFEITGPPFTQIGVGAVLRGAAGCRVRVRLLIGDAAVVSVDTLALGTDTDASRWPTYPLPSTGKLRLRIEGIDSPGQPIGRQLNVPYTLDVYAVDPAPEVAPVDLALGDSLTTETIARCGDEDLFNVVGPPGTVVVVTAGFGRATTCGIRMNSENNYTRFFPYGSNADAMRFGHVTIPESGRVPLAVTADRLGSGADRGAPYFVKATAVNTAPELVPAALALNDTVTETISRCGDIDRFLVPLVAGEAYIIRATRARTSTCALTITLRNGTFQGADLWFQESESDSLGPVVRYDEAPVTGTYELTAVSTPSGNTSDRDLPYSLTVTSEMNEAASTALALGDTSAIEAWQQGDFDLFTVPLQAGREYAAATIGPIQFATREWPDGLYQISFEEYPRGYRVTLTPTSTGPRRFRMGLGDVGPELPTSYRFTVHEVNRRPESAPDTLRAGDTTTVERFEHPGDEDDFIARLAFGHYFRLEAHLPPGMGGAVGGQISAANDGMIIGYPSLQNGSTTERILVPPGGTIVTRLWNFLAPSDTTQAPGYRLRLVDIDPAPETRPSGVAPGDSVVNEPLNDAWDLDTYTFSVATSGQHAVQFQAAASSCGVVAGDDRLRLVVLNGVNTIATIHSRTDASAAGTVVLGAGVTYAMRAEAAEPALGACVMRNYRIKVALAP